MEGVHSVCHDLAKMGGMTGAQQRQGVLERKTLCYTTDSIPRLAPARSVEVLRNDK